MTREEAIDVIKCLAWHTRPNEEDIEQAIEALEQQPCEDYVDKKELLKSIEVALNATNINDEYAIGLRNGMRVVKSFVDGKRPDYEKASHLKKQEPCEDCISRQAVIEWLIDKNIIKTKNQEENARRELAELPSVTPQPKVGHWMHPYKSDIACECSECRIQIPITKDFKFCPNCGAKMEVSE